MVVVEHICPQTSPKMGSFHVLAPCLKEVHFRWALASTGPVEDGIWEFGV